MCLCAHLHEIAQQSGVVCRAIALLSQVERGAKVAVHAAYAGCINPMCGAQPLLSSRNERDYRRKRSLMPSKSKASERRNVWSKGLLLAVAMR